MVQHTVKTYAGTSLLSQRSTLTALLQLLLERDFQVERRGNHSFQPIGFQTILAPQF